MRAVALPVSSAAQAMGGAIVSGARVDVIAVPVAGRAPGGRATELLLQGAIVLDVRSESGSAYGAAASKGASSSLTERMGSVVIAIDPLDEVRFADRIATSMFVLTLAGCTGGQKHEKHTPTSFAPRQSIPSPAVANDPLLGSSTGRPIR